jgi:hypothetical protein
MRILVDLASHLSAPLAGTPLITQVEQNPPPGVEGQTAINGRYSIPVPKGISFPVDTSSYVLDGAGLNDGGDVVSQAFAHLLASYPMYGNIYFNPLLTDSDVAELDLTATFKDSTDPNAPVYLPTRVQTGRAASSLGPAAGCMPTHTAILAANTAAPADPGTFVLIGGSPSHPGILVTDNIDIGPYTLDAYGNPVGTDDFVVYWKLYAFDVTQDVATDYGALAGQNEPALRYLQETDQEPPGFRVYISPDDGANWCEVGLLEPVAFGAKTTSFRLAFRNDGANKVYLAQFAVLF